MSLTMDGQRRTASNKALDRSGCLLLVIGASGVGKDSLIAGCQQALQPHPRLQFARRVITRDAQTSTEHHISVDDETFEQWRHEGRFAVHWEANHLKYALPAETHQAVLNGKVVIANGSRGALESIRKAYPRVRVIHVTASAGILRARLRLRGRESDTLISARLARHATMTDRYPDCFEIDNSGELSHSIAQMTALVADALDEPCQ